MDTLTTTESTRLIELESTIETGLKTFVEVGNALMEIRDSRLYRMQFGTFEDYCRDRWGMVASRARQLISAAEVMENLKSVTIVTQNVNDTLLPQTESQARPLSRLTPQLQREVWPIVVDTAPNGKITADHVQKTVESFRPMKPKSSRPIDVYTPQGYDACQTPPHAIDPLLFYLPEGWNIWEPAAGEGYLEGALYDSGFSVIPSDILTGQNFFEFEPDNWDAIVTNPPYSIKYKFLERCYRLGKPFALLMPVETLGTESGAVLFDEFGVEVIFVRPRINFKMPNQGWDGSGAQFPVAWFTFGLNIGRQITFAKVVPDKELTI